MFVCTALQMEHYHKAQTANVPKPVANKNTTETESVTTAEKVQEVPFSDPFLLPGVSVVMNKSQSAEEEEISMPEVEWDSQLLGMLSEDKEENTQANR